MLITTKKIQCDEYISVCIGQVTDDLRTGVQDIKFSSTDVSFSLLDDFELGQAVTVQTTSPVQQIDIENSHAYNGKIGNTSSFPLRFSPPPPLLFLLSNSPPQNLRYLR